MTRKQIFSWFFFGIFIFLIYLFYQIIKPFIFSLFWAAIISLILYPVHERLTRFMRNRVGVSSLLMTLLSTLVLVVPVVIVITTLAVEMFDAYQSLRDKLELVKLRSMIEHLKELIPVTVLEEIERRFNVGELKLEQIILTAVGTISRYIFDQVQQGAKNLTSIILSFIVMIFAMFFFFRDGRKLYEELKYLIPMTEEQKNRIFDRFYDILNAVILGIIATAAVQGFITGIIFWALGISFAVLGGVITFVFSLLPIGGSAFVWFPVGVYLLVSGEFLKGTVLLLLGGLVVSSVDNILKPLIIGGRVKLPTLFLFLSILGSVKAFGFSGIILGPVVLVVFLSFIEIYKTEYREAGD
ncbi:MAG: AI-2E family transporter [Deltaproteobacteria bacterium]|jgi:predicted PurR-regulated permease PerM|nr:MAG: AI-2E family transporter [Deltaproteobacteria bacterium]